MTDPSRSRDRFRLGISTVTAAVSAGTLASVGWFAGTAAREQHLKLARDDAAQASADATAARARARYDAAMAKRRSASFARRIVLRQRPSRTVVSTQYVHSSATPVVVGGGTFTSSGSAPPPPTVPHAPTVHQAAPPPPPPPPPPAPTSGSHHG